VCAATNFTLDDIREVACQSPRIAIAKPVNPRETSSQEGQRDGDHAVVRKMTISERVLIASVLREGEIGAFRRLLFRTKSRRRE
jgi:hypothetical protein